MKKIKATYLVLGIVIGLLFSSFGPSKEVLVTKEVKVEVPVEVIVEKEVKVEVVKTVIKTVYIEQHKSCKKSHNNRFIVGYGVGYDGSMNYSKNGSDHTIKTKKTGLVKAGYARKLDHRISVGVSLMTNKSATLDLGLDF